MVPQVMNFHPNGSLKMVFDITVSGEITLTPLTQQSEDFIWNELELYALFR